MFVAVNGVTTDAHQYIPDVISKGAVAIVCEHLPEKTEDDITYIVVENSASALGFLASEWFGNPSRN